jgi:hypothetical protein
LYQILSIESIQNGRYNEAKEIVMMTMIEAMVARLERWLRRDYSGGWLPELDSNQQPSG